MSPVNVCTTTCTILCHVVDIAGNCKFLLVLTNAYEARTAKGEGVHSSQSQFGKDIYLVSRSKWQHKDEKNYKNPGNIPRKRTWPKTCTNLLTGLNRVKHRYRDTKSCKLKDPPSSVCFFIYMNHLIVVLNLVVHLIWQPFLRYFATRIPCIYYVPTN